jgi:hypothetical protein
MTIGHPCHLVISHGCHIDEIKVMKTNISHLLPPHHVPLMYEYKFLNIGFEVIVYDQSHTYSQLGLVIIDFLAAKDKISSSAF